MNNFLTYNYFCASICDFTIDPNTKIPEGITQIQI
jgi:hypothetical protein